MSFNSINLDANDMMAGKTTADHEGYKVQTETKIQTETTNSDKKAVTFSESSLGKLREEIEEANHRLQLSDRRCEFRMVEGTHRVAIKVINRDTDEIIREIPSEEALEMIKKMKEMTGLLIDQQG